MFLKGVSLSRTFKKGTFYQFSLKQKIKTLVKDFSHIFRHIFELVKNKFSFENKKKSRTYGRSRAAFHHGQLILRAWYCPKFSSETHIYLFFFIHKGLPLIVNLKNCKTKCFLSIFWVTFQKNQIFHRFCLFKMR